MNLLHISSSPRGTDSESLRIAKVFTRPTPRATRRRRRPLGPLGRTAARHGVGRQGEDDGLRRRQPSARRAACGRRPARRSTGSPRPTGCCSACRCGTRASRRAQAVHRRGAASPAGSSASTRSRATGICWPTAARASPSIYTSAVWGPRRRPGVRPGLQSTYFDDWLRWSGLTDVSDDPLPPDAHRRRAPPRTPPRSPAPATSPRRSRRRGGRAMASAARRPLTSAPWVDGVSRWSPATKRPVAQLDRAAHRPAGRERGQRVRDSAVCRCAQCVGRHRVDPGQLARGSRSPASGRRRPSTVDGHQRPAGRRVAGAALGEHHDGVGHRAARCRPGAAWAARRAGSAARGSRWSGRASRARRARAAARPRSPGRWRPAPRGPAASRPRSTRCGRARPVTRRPSAARRPAAGRPAGPAARPSRRPGTAMVPSAKLRQTSRTNAADVLSSASPSTPDRNGRRNRSTTGPVRRGGREVLGGRPVDPRRGARPAGVASTRAVQAASLALPSGPSSSSAAVRQSSPGRRTGLPNTCSRRRPRGSRRPARTGAGASASRSAAARSAG